MKDIQRTVRVQAEYMGASSVRYTWPCGHQRTETLMVPRPGGGKVPMMPEMVRRLAHYWAGENNGVSVPPCRICLRRRGKEGEGEGSLK